MMDCTPAIQRKMHIQANGLKFGKSATARHLRRDVFLRDDFTCRECGYRPPVVPDTSYDGSHTVGDFPGRPSGPCDFEQRHLQLDHVVPLCKGGAPKDRDNLQTLCNVCNARKSGH